MPSPACCETCSFSCARINQSQNSAPNNKKQDYHPQTKLDTLKTGGYLPEKNWWSWQPLAVWYGSGLIHMPT